MVEPNPPSPQTDSKQGLQGVPVRLDDLLNLTTYDEQDIDEAVRWWDENASPGWQGALEE